ncbi:MAG: hypothetical protein FWH11_02260 [Micrococcales bacterium]|nr:hypothetical protein [Micrococcales bacterium]
MATVQVALWASGRNMARNAANGAVVVASLEGGTPDQAVAEAESRLGHSDLLRTREVDVQVSGGQVRATVTGEVVSLVPGVPVRVTVTSVGPVERWTSP